jgi:hypothetical protein
MTIKVKAKLEKINVYAKRPVPPIHCSHGKAWVAVLDDSQ